MSVSTGAATLDAMLDGGYPEGRSILLTGTPGTGKSTLAMQFLQAGLDAGDDCLFVSTEQTVDELADAFAPFEFDLDRENLEVTSLHARTGRTFESTSPELVIERLGGGEVFGSGVAAPFNSERIREALDRFGPVDRVVLDSVTGLEPMAEDRNVFRRGVLDLIQLFTDGFGATALLTAEYVGARPLAEGREVTTAENTVQYNAHGVIRLWRESRGGDLRRFVDVMKMRGVDHDTRRHELSFTGEGVAISPRRRSPSASEFDHPTLSTGVEDFDDLLGGGFPKGRSTLIEYDGLANVSQLLFTAAVEALDDGMDVVLIPRVNTSPRQIDALLRESGLAFDTIHDAMDEGRLFIVDSFTSWGTHENVFSPGLEEVDLQAVLEQIRERSESEALFMVLNTEAKVHMTSADAARRFVYWVRSQFLTEEDVLLDVHNPNLMGEGMAEFYIDAASLGIRTWLDDSGLQYVRLKKGQVGQVGNVRLVGYPPEPPFVSMQ